MTTTLLQINTSLFSENGQSSKLAQDYVEAWRSRHSPRTRCRT